MRRDVEPAGQTGTATLTDWWPSKGAWTRSDALVAGIVAVLTAVIAWVFRSEIVSTDPWHYVMAAIEFPQHSWVPLGYTRYGMILPLGPLVLAWGYAPATFYAPAIVASAGLAAAVYLVGRRFWGRIAGLTAVALLLSNWVVFTNLSRFYPDITSMALVMLAFVFAIAARDHAESRPRFADLLVIASGFILGWSFEARETALFAWPLVIVALWSKGRVVRNAVLAAAPVVVWAIVDVTIGAVAYGDPLLKLHTFTRQDLSATTNPADLAVMNQFVGLPRLDYLTMIPRRIVENRLPGGAWFLALAAVALLGLFVRNTAVRLSSAAFVVSYILFVGIGGFFVPTHPAGRLDVARYWIQFVPWIALAASGVVYTLVRASLRGRRLPHIAWVHAVVSVVLVVVSVVTVLPAIRTSPTLATNGGAVLSDVSNSLAHQRPARGAAVYTDWQTMRLLPIYRHPAFGGKSLWTPPVRSLTGKSQPNPGDYVLLVNATSSPCGFCTAALQPWRKAHLSPPPSWRQVFASEDDGYILYEVR